MVYIASMTWKDDAWRRRAAMLLTVAVAIVVPVSVRAQTPAAAPAQVSAAEAAIAKGIELRRQGKNREALELFREAHRLQPTPRAKAQMGLAEQAIGRWADAARDLSDALKETGDPWIVRTRPVLVDAMGVISRHVGTLSVTGEPEGAVVELDGDPAGTLPLQERQVASGEVVVTVRAPGYTSLSRKVMISPGELAAEDFKLRRQESERLAITAAPMRPPGEPVSTSPISPPPSGDQPPPSGGNRLRLAAWTTAAAAGLSVVAGTTFLLMGKSKADTFNDDDRCDLVDGHVTDTTGGAACQGLYDSWHTRRAIGYVGLAVGGLLAATSAVLFVRMNNSAATPVATACGPGLGTSVGCVFRF